MYSFPQIYALAVSLVWLALPISLVPPAEAIPSPVACLDAQFADTRGPWQGYPAGGSPAQLVALEIPSPGWLAVEAAKTGTGSGSLWLRTVGECGGIAPSTSSAVFLDRGLIEVREAGWLYLQIGDVRSSEASGQVRLVTHLMKERNAGEKDGGLGDNTEEDDGEIVPLADDDGCALRKGWQRANSPFGKDGGLGDNTEEDDGEIVPLLGGKPGCGSICAGSGEPHNNLLLCALELQRSVPSRQSIVKAGLDLDYFAFDVPRFESLRVLAAGENQLELALLDGLGRVLTRTELDGVDPVDLTLPPGRYFLRVSGAEGDYEIQLLDSPATH